MPDDFLQVTVGKFIFRVKPGCLYSEAGVWVALFDQPEQGTARIGLTDYRQQSSGDVAFVDLPEVGRRCCTGTIGQHRDDQGGPGGAGPVRRRGCGLNGALADGPELINQDPYGAGWLAELRPAAWPAPGLLDAGRTWRDEAQAEEGANSTGHQAHGVCIVPCSGIGKPTAA